MTQPNLTTKIFTILKWILAVFFFIMMLGMLMDKAYISTLILIITILLVLPPLSNFWMTKSPFLKNKWIKGVAVFVLFIFSFMINPNLDKHSNTDYLSTTSKVKEMKFENKKEILINYIKTDTLNKSIRNIKYLEKIGDLFGNINVSTLYPDQDYISEYQDTITKKKVLLFNPKYKFSEAKSYLKTDNKNGIIEDYTVFFEIDNEGRIISEKTVIAFSKTGKVDYSNDEVPEIKIFVDEKTVKEQEEVVVQERIAKERKEAYEKKKEKFEEDCLSGWDGSETKLVSYVKDNMNDPKSFEHVETRYKVMDDYAIVIMRFRGKNAFGGTVLNSVTAKVSLDDGSVISIEN